MKLLLIVFLFSLAACGSESSPEGRLTLKYENLRAEIVSLKHQNIAILDSISTISKELDDLKHK